jgi:hypothetical protein
LTCNFSQKEKKSFDFVTHVPSNKQCRETPNDAPYVSIGQFFLFRKFMYNAVDLDRDAGTVRCFRHVTVGLRMHGKLGVAPERDSGRTTADFTAFLREAYAAREERLLLVRRAHDRRLVNAEEAVRDDPSGAGVDALARDVNSFDALLGAHGAGLTNAVVIQVVPYGSAWRGPTSASPWRTWGSSTSSTAWPPRRAR